MKIESTILNSFFPHFFMIVFICLSFNVEAIAADIVPPSDDEIHAATLEACNLVTAVDFRDGLKSDDLHAGRFPSARFTKILDDIRFASFQNGMWGTTDSLDRVAWIVGSNAFEYALNECYGNDTQSIHLFRKAVRQSSEAGYYASFAVKTAALLIFDRGILKLARVNPLAALGSKVWSGIQLGYLGVLGNQMWKSIFPGSVDATEKPQNVDLMEKLLQELRDPTTRADLEPAVIDVKKIIDPLAKDK